MALAAIEKAGSCTTSSHYLSLQTSFLLDMHTSKLLDIVPLREHYSQLRLETPAGDYRTLPEFT